MNRSVVRLLVSVAFLSFPTFVSAGPGAAVISLRILPADVPKVIAAYENDPDWFKFLTAMQAVSKYRGADLSRTLKVWGRRSLTR